MRTIDLQQPLLSEQPPSRSRLAIAAAGLALVVVVTGGSCLYAGSRQQPRLDAILTPYSDTPYSDTPYSGPRLQFVNGCKKDPLWIAGFSVALPVFTSDVKLEAGQTHSVDIPDAGLPSTRFWAKWGCDASGQNCVVGQSGGPGESCPPIGCAPPVDSKFEATFGCLPGTAECAANPSAPWERLTSVDWWDVSQVDGWTLPYKVELLGPCDAPRVIDCSGLTFDGCPAVEELGLLEVHSLRLQQPEWFGEQKRTVGCYSPCGKLTFSNWGQGLSYTTSAPEARDFCCPTPPIQPADCSAGPVEDTAYVKMVHKLCPSVYAYAYDDGVGLSQCPAGTGYKVTFYCPDFVE